MLPRLWTLNDFMAHHAAQCMGPATMHGSSSIAWAQLQAATSSYKQLGLRMRDSPVCSLRRDGGHHVSRNGVVWCRDVRGTRTAVDEVFRNWKKGRSDVVKVPSSEFRQSEPQEVSCGPPHVQPLLCSPVFEYGATAAVQVPVVNDNISAGTDQGIHRLEHIDRGIVGVSI